MTYADYYRINIDIATMYRLNDMLLTVDNSSHNTNVTINERVCFSTPPYYLDWFEKYHPNVPLNRYDGPFCPQCTNGIQGIKTAGKLVSAP